MSDLTKQQFQTILEAELSVVKSDISAIKADLNTHPTHDDMKTLMKNELKHYATKSDLKKLESKIDDMGQTIVDAIERGLSVKADKTEVISLSKRVEKLEKTIVIN